MTSAPVCGRRLRQLQTPDIGRVFSQKTGKMPSKAHPNTSTLSSVLIQLHDLYKTHIFPHLPPPLQSASSYVDPALASGDIVSLAAFLLAVYLTLRIADYIRRSILSWIVLLLKIALLLLLVQGVVYVQQYGWQMALRDAGWLGGIVWNFVEDAMQDNETGQYGQRNYRGGRNGQAWNVAGRQQVPVGRGQTKRRGAWT